MKPYNAQEGTGWFGINEIRKGRVSKLELPANGLTGELPEAIYALDGMRTLNLSGNGLTGSLSPEIGRLKLISSLNLSNNRLSGEIPGELIFLGAEARTSKPREDGKGGNEIKILLNKNQLTGPIPAAIGDMALLAKPAKSISLDLSYNRLTGEIPASVAQLTEPDGVQRPPATASRARCPRRWSRCPGSNTCVWRKTPSRAPYPANNPLTTKKNIT